MASNGVRANRSRIRTFSFYKWGVIAFLFFLGVINFADKTIIGFAAVPIMKSLGLTHKQFGFVGSAFFWLFSISALVVGRLSDRFCTKSLLGGMAAIWALVQFATVFVIRLPQLVATRVALGAAEGPAYNLSIHQAAKWVPPSERAFGFTWVTIGSSLGPALAAPVLLYFIFHYGWRSAFTLLGVVGILWVIAWLVFAKENPQSVGLTSPEPIDDGHPRASIALRNLLPILISRDFLIVNFAAFANYWGIALLIFWVPPYLQQVRHISHGHLQYLEGLPWLVSAFASLLINFIADRVYRRTQSSRKSRVFMVGAVGILSSVFWYYFVTVTSTREAIVFLLIACALGSPFFPLASAIVSDMVLPEHRGTLLGVLIGVATTAGLLAPAVSGILIQAGAHQSGYAHSFMLMAALGIGASLLLLIGVRPPRPGETPDYAKKLA